MPEGDTILRAAATLNRALAGSAVTKFETQLPALARIDADHPLTGRTIEFARADGKWLQIGFSGDLILLTHMLMSGSWHIYRPGERWRKTRYHMRVVIATEKIVAVAFNVPVAEFHTSASLERRKGFNQLGPDVLSENFDLAQAVANLASNAGTDIGTALLNQSLVAGIGNMFKSETCFVAGINPFQKIAALSHQQLQQLVTAARTLMSPAIRGPLWVYRRNGEPCRRCSTPILSRKQGPEARTTFWCPTCQILAL